MCDKTEGTIPLESPPPWGFCAGISGVWCFPSSKGDALSKEGVILWPGIPRSLLPRDMGSGALNAQLQPLLLPGRARPWDPAERREGSTKPRLGKGQKEGDADSRGKSCTSWASERWFWCSGTVVGMLLALGRDDEAWAVPSSMLGAGSSHRVPSEVGLAGAGLTIPLALLQRRLGNDLGLKQHNTFLNAVYEEEPDLTGG